MHKTQVQILGTLILTLACFLQIQIEICEGIPVLELNSARDSPMEAMAKTFCEEKAGKCSNAGVEEEMMDSESNRRVLWMQKRYISYDTLRRDLVPCDRPGASYYNCRTPGVGNSYNRGCEVITRCARGG